MSLIKEYRELEAEIKDLQNHLIDLKSDPKLRRDLALLEDIDKVLEKHDRSRNYLMTLINPAVRRQGSRIFGAGRMPTKIKRYKNPYNGEVVETRSGNNKVIKAWKAQYPNDDIESWATIFG